MSHDKEIISIRYGINYVLHRTSGKSSAVLSSVTLSYEPSCPNNRWMRRRRCCSPCNRRRLGRHCLGVNSLSYCFFSLQNRLLHKLSLPLHLRYVVFFLHSRITRQLLMLAMIRVQLIRDIGITDGDETRVGYYVGLMVSLI